MEACCCISLSCIENDCMSVSKSCNPDLKKIKKFNVSQMPNLKFKSNSIFSQQQKIFSFKSTVILH